MKKILIGFLAIASTATFSADLTRTTKAGVVFARDTTHPRLGEAWKDPSGLIWGDIARKADGSYPNIIQEDANRYCASIGARLPTKDELIKLGQDLGYQSYHTYAPLEGAYDPYSDPDIIANIILDIGNSAFWSSTEKEERRGDYYFFDTNDGSVGALPGHWYVQIQARCVAR